PDRERARDAARDAAPDPFPRPAIPCAGAERHPEHESRLEGHLPVAGGLHRRHSAGDQQHRRLDGSLPHRGASGGRHDDALYCAVNPEASMKRMLTAGLLLLLAAVPVRAQRAADMAPAVRNYVTVDAPVIALTNVKVIDG